MDRLGLWNGRGRVVSKRGQVTADAGNHARKVVAMHNEILTKNYNRPVIQAFREFRGLIY